MRALSLAIAAALLAGCGSPPPAKTSADEVPIKTTSAGEACVASAATKREKRANEPETITAKHVLVRWSGAKNADASVKRTREEACLRAAEARDKVRGGAEWDDVVKEYSEEAGASTRGGTLGSITRKDVLAPFGDAAFELDVNQMSDVVETDRGFHIILRSQ